MRMLASEHPHTLLLLVQDCCLFLKQAHLVKCVCVQGFKILEAMNHWNTIIYGKIITPNHNCNID